MSSPVDERLMTSKEVATFFGIGVRTLSRWTTEGLVPSVKIGPRLRRYRLSEIREYVNQLAAAQRKD